MLSRTGLARDVLIVTLCGALWLAVLMSAADDWQEAEPASTPLALPADSKPESKATEVDKVSTTEELPLFLDSKTTPTQTKPDDPASDLVGGVTVASKSAPRPSANRTASIDKPAKVELLQVSADKLPAPQVDRSPESLGGRQASLSYGGDETEVALVDQRTALTRQDAPSKKPLTQPRQFLPRSEPGNRALPPATAKQTPLRAQPQPLKQQPMRSAQLTPDTQRVKVETQQLTDVGAKKPTPLMSQATAPTKTTLSTQKPAIAKAPKPAINPATKPASQSVKPLTAVNKPAAQIASPDGAKPSTLAARAKPKAQLNGGARIMTPQREVARQKVNVPMPEKASPAVVHHSEATPQQDALPVLPEGEELVTADLLAAAPAPAPALELAAETLAPTPIPPVSSLTESGSQPQTLRADSNVVINTVSSAPIVTPSIVFMALLAIALFVLWLWLRRRPTPPTPLTLLQQKAVSVIETISLAPGRQIVLVEVSGSALVLGVTAQSINLLQRLPLAVLAQNYQPTVESIIVRESAQGVQWAEAPRMAAAGGGRPVMPFSYPRAAGTAVRTSLAELRREQSLRSQNLSVVGAEADRD